MSDFLPVLKQKPATALMKSPNPQIPDAVWRLIQMNASAAVTRLAAMISSPSFVKYSPKDQLKIIELATTMAYKQEAVQKHVHLHAGEEGDNASNALKSLSNRALQLPEMRSAPSPAMGNVPGHLADTKRNN